MDATLLRRKAALCRQLAGAASTQEIRTALEALARELEEEAAAIERGEQCPGTGEKNDPASS